jgi:hypothetical protein
MATSAARRRTLDPKNDVVFKLLFAAERNRDVLTAGPERHEGYSLCPALELHFPGAPQTRQPGQ